MWSGMCIRIFLLLKNKQKRSFIMEKIYLECQNGGNEGSRLVGAGCGIICLGALCVKGIGC